MYAIVLTLHSVTRWLVLISLVVAIFRGYLGWFKNKIFTVKDDTLRHVTATIAHIQLILGLWLYFVSPVINYFLHNYKTAVHENQVRFFGMEHSTMMFVAIVLITIGSAVAKRKKQIYQNLNRWLFGILLHYLLF